MISGSTSIKRHITAREPSSLVKVYKLCIEESQKDVEFGAWKRGRGCDIML